VNIRKTGKTGGKNVRILTGTSKEKQWKYCSHWSYIHRARGENSEI
jgi:hypothetical protein